MNLLVNEREIQTFYVLAKLGYLLKSVTSTLLFQIMFHIGVMQEEEMVYVFRSEMYLITPVNINIAKPKGIEDVWVSVHSNKLPSVIIDCLYRHPKSLSDTFDYIGDVLDFINFRNKPFFNSF